MSDKNMPAFPVPSGQQHTWTNGLTRREEFVKAAMAAVIANPSLPDGSVGEVAWLAVAYADATLKELGYD